MFYEITYIMSFRLKDQVILEIENKALEISKVCYRYEAIYVSNPIMINGKYFLEVKILYGLYNTPKKYIFIVQENDLKD